MPKPSRKRITRKPLPVLDAMLQASMHRMSARDPMFFGWHLAHLRAARNQTVEQQAADLKLTPSALAMLAMCRVPRADHRDDDLQTVTAHVGLTLTALLDSLPRADASGSERGGELVPKP